MTVTRARKTALFTFACTVLPILAVTHVGNWAAVLLIGIAGASHQAWSANLFTSASDMFPKRAVASVVGHRQHGRLAGRDPVPDLLGEAARPLSAAAGNVTAGLRDPVRDLRLAYLVAFALQHLLAPTFAPIQSPA